MRIDERADRIPRTTRVGRIAALERRGERRSIKIRGDAAKRVRLAQALVIGSIPPATIN
ncbi:MAG: hypothetical protein M5R36_05905 [Deltaproteobacteria bacterium]|nr:hypothetical protein [Deltaproteobacteria bacterium]